MDINKNLEICISAVTLAGNFLKENKEILNITNSSQGRDIKLVADIESEKLITEYLQVNSDYPILGEEAGQSKDLGSIYWVVALHVFQILGPMSCICRLLQRLGNKFP